MKYLLILLTALLSGCAATGTSPVSNPSKIAYSDTMRIIADATAAAPNKVAGEYTFYIKAAGSVNGRVYLNTELDYRDQRNVTVALSRGMARHFDLKFKQPSEHYFIDKTIKVTGEAFRVKIAIPCNGEKTEMYYYQTHIRVTEKEQIEIMAGAPKRVAQAKQDKQEAEEKKYSRLDLALNRFASYQHKKAFALARDEKLGWRSGLGIGFETQEQADQKALEQCNQRRIERGITRECVIYARGDDIPKTHYFPLKYQGCTDPAYI